MGLILCVKHGESGMVFTCSHITNVNRKENEIADIVKRDERDNPNDDYDWFKGHRIYCLCKSCDEEYSELKYADFPKNFFKPNCGKCFLELLNLETWY
jgi:hypothetical protein